jgi:hypothetical protein
MALRCSCSCFGNGVIILKKDNCISLKDSIILKEDNSNLKEVMGAKNE